jgi:ribonuclease HI
MTKIVENALVFYTDGSCHPKGRKGGFGVLFLYYDDVGNEIELDTYIAPSLKGTTSQRMELAACVKALKMAPKIECYPTVNSVVIRTDSQYIVEYHYSALTHWRGNGWCNRDGKPVDNADLWREFVRAYEKIRKSKLIEKVKGHGKGLEKDPHNYRADDLAKLSRENPIARVEYRSSVRRKKSPRTTEVGSIGVQGQQLRIHVIETERLRIQKKWKYRCEVVSTDSPYFENVDWLYSDEDLRDGHYYEVLLNDNPKNPTIVEKIRELELVDDDNSEGSSGEKADS